MMTFAAIVFGLLLLVGGGELLVRGAVSLANLFRVSPLLIGLVLVGFGTSTPELVTSLLAAFREAPGIAIGNVVGSNTANILLILGLAATLAAIPVQRSSFWRDAAVLSAASLAALAAALNGRLEAMAGLFFLAALAAYIFVVYRQEKRQDHPIHEHAGDQKILPVQGGRGKAIAIDLGIFIVGLLLTFAGAHFLVSGSIDFAQYLGVPDTIIGLTIVAVGTSMPELVASVMAAIRGQAEMSYGNIVGSNIYNIFGILGITSIVHPLDVPPQIASFDIWVMIGAAAILLTTAMSGWVIRRKEGAIMLALYAAYTGWLIHIST